MVHLRLATTLRSPFLTASPRQATRSAVRSSSVLAANVSAFNSPDHYLDTLKESRLDSLRHVLLNEGNPSHVWVHYTNLLNYFSYDILPLELHQQVLRQCSPPAQILRISAARRRLQGRRQEHPHLYEGRFQTVISNIRALGRTPSLQDYHFVLEQFAAVGHHIGSLQVYQELVHLGLTPDPKTFGLCLQAIAHRLTLPIPKLYQSRLLVQTRKALDDLMSDMRKFQTPLTSANLDLAIRIFKETIDKEGFDTLIKWTYAVDLANPDRPPLEFLESQPHPNLPSFQPLSTYALNTIIDTLGRFGDISKLVQAFEVLTQPLPNASQHIFTSFDDDDDFGVSVDLPTPPSFSPPYASPNTTTYNMLLRHVGRADHAILVRHYLLQAIELERLVHTRVRKQILSGVSLEEVKAPHFAINRTMLLSAFGHTNRYKNLGLMRWLSTKIPLILRIKKRDLDFFTNLQATIDGPSDQSVIHTAEGKQVKTYTTPLPSRQFNSMISSTKPKPLHNVYTDLKKLGTAFDVDVNTQVLPDPSVDKILDIDLHIRILNRDMAEISAFAQHLDKILGRTTQRLKERLGRRVWAGKDVYLLTEEKRTVVSRERWREIVRFQPRRGGLARDQRRSSYARNAPPHLPSRGSPSVSANVSAIDHSHSPTGTLISKLRSFLLS